MTTPTGIDIGEQIHAWVEDPATGGAIMCPHCDLEMACIPDTHGYYCGNGHWISHRDVRSAD